MTIPDGFSLTLSAHDARRIAVAAAVHPKTVARAYAGLPVRSTSAARIVEAARILGLPQPLSQLQTKTVPVPGKGPGVAKRGR